MEEENKQEVVEVKEEPKQEQPAEQQNSGLDEDSKFSLATFIVACVGFVVCGGWIIGGIACAVLGIIAFGRLKNCKSTKQPYKAFDIASKPIAIVDIVIGFLSAAGYTIKLVIDIVNSIKG